MSDLVIRPDADLVLASINSAIEETGPDRNVRLVLRDLAAQAKESACHALIECDLGAAKKAITAAVSCDAAMAIVMFLGPEKLIMPAPANEEPAKETAGESDPGGSGVPSGDDDDEPALDDMNRKDLLAYAKELGIQGLSQHSKEDILITIQEALDSTEPDGTEN